MKMFPTREELIDEPEFHEWVEEITDQLHDANCIKLKRVPSNPQTYSRLSKELKKSNWKLEGECVYALVSVERPLLAALINSVALISTFCIFYFGLHIKAFPSFLGASILILYFNYEHSSIKKLLSLK